MKTDLRGRYTTADLRADLQREITNWQSLAGASINVDGMTIGPAFAKEFVLKYGRDYTAAPWPRKRMMMKGCYRNAYKLVESAFGLRHKPTYVEGYAVNRWITEHIVAHAWCINSDNFVVDPTWDEGTEYFGVPFRHDYLRRVLKARRDYGLIDNAEMDFPLVTGAHRVHEAVVDRRD